MITVFLPLPNHSYNNTQISSSSTHYDSFNKEPESIISNKKFSEDYKLKTLLTLLGSLLLFSSCSSSRGVWKKHIVKAGPEIPGVMKNFPDVNAISANDFDKDGHIDIIASFHGKVALYKGPDWKERIVLPQMPKDRTGRIAKRGCIHATLIDVDQDGDLDFVGSNRMLFWLECPDKPFEDEWVCRMISLDVNGAHCIITADVDRDGKIDLIANSWRDQKESPIPDSITWFSTPKNPKDGKLWQPNIFANRDAPGRNHYMGFGDVNKDGRGDIACGAPAGGWFAWWEQPMDPTKAWKKHMLSDKDDGATNILVLDLNNDGHMDFLGSRGHTKGILWFKGPDYEKIEIDPDFLTPHSLAAKDLDGDGDLDFVSCSSNLNGVAAWYENDGKGKFTKHVIDNAQSSYDIRLNDIDKDGDLDILIGGHSNQNIVWYENPLK